MDPDLLAAIYEAAVITEKWPAVLDRLADLTGACAAAIVALSPAKRAKASTTAGYAQPYATLEKIPYDNSRVERFLARRHFGFETDLDLCTQLELDNDPLYKAALYPFGIGWTAGTAIPMPTGDVVVFDLAHKISDGPFDRTVVSQLDQLRPHLARASLISARLRLEQARVAADILGGLGLPTCVVTEQRQVLAANAGFSDLVQVQIGSRDRLSLTHSAADEMLGNALQRASASSTRSVQSIPVPRGRNTDAVVMHVIPLHRSARDLFSTADSVIVATPVRAPAAPLVEVLNGLFDLTAAEAHLAHTLSEGLDVSDVALNSRRSVETVRSHLKSLMAKTGVRRQSDLLRLLDATHSIPIK